MIFTVLGVKGGVGKSTISMGVSLWMSKKKRVLLIDGDPRVRSVELKLCPEVRGSLSDVMSGKKHWTEAVSKCTLAGEVKPAYPKLSIMPAGRAFLPPAETRLDRIKLGGRILDEMFDEVSKRFDHVVIDTPPSVSYEHLLLTAAGERIVYVCEANDDSILATKLVARDLSRVFELPPAGVILSKLMERGELEMWKNKSEEIAPLLGVVPFDARVDESFRRNLPVVAVHPRCEASISLKEIAEKLVGEKGARVSVEERLEKIIARLRTS
jgi:MinD-like ATPase involved in chromosome partitioning or flagellar assembly